MGSQDQTKEAVPGFPVSTERKTAFKKLVRTTHIRRAIGQKLLQSVNLEVDLAMKVEHHSNKPSEIALQEADVLAVLDIFQNTFMNPFTQDDGLYIISSGAKVPEEIAEEILMRDEWGVKKRNA